MRPDEYVVELRMECHALACAMVRLDRDADEARDQRRFVRVGDLNARRLDVQEHRSMLLRQLWVASGQRRIHEALREA